MQYKYSLLTAASLVGSSIAAYIPSEPWATLTPKEPAPSGAVTDYTKTFGIAVVPFATSSAAPKAKRDVVSQIGDGQIQATTATAKPSAQVVSQIGDGQIQATTSTAPAPKPTAQVVSQIGDGQIQATTSTAKPTAQVVSQIGDGQIQATTSTAAPKSTAQVVSQIGDGQIQATTSTAQVVSQIGDGQIQATTKTTDVASQIGDGQVQATSTASSAKATESSSGKDSGIDVQSSSCLTDSSLALTLKDSVLTDAHGRIGSIVANRQFQFDGPPPQAGAIYAAGWSITEDGNLAIGNVSTFYQCLSGNFYNLYDESLGEQCHPIHLEIVDLVKC
ncbi:hypothetical protein WICANDRAFT_34930 [Wickerhamomyces anomalus NRRL Y-366-8]|uniref:Cell wall mannoprotein PIR1-like C-terminal domain-containing protein n=1 Tax=Wickerhamomyces anomalus (strain ATCC 58044 / CBS 1984 / NCYC 433 / NRRL Y-366-8) TaxID=683960 RepID=A0A1E3NY76_WICAA|nr:uncharacterized protein WICANDRAFT_34930 [Wickerhamomyces anomalus NRRL Y-366-8]ODQ57652.1 hypothetical protein WICANDRAFT_34930 [Wickerhamomyces anomalus NRRL Y-366-8]